MKILSVFNQKGGVGKTTATINLGAAFALMLSYEAKPSEAPGRVLVVDLDQQAHSDITLSGGFFGKRASLPLGPYDNIAGLLMLETTRPILEIIAAADIPLRARGNMDYIPSSKKKMMNVDAALRSDPVDGLFRLREILTPIDSMYRYAVIDNPPGLSHLSVNSLVAATHVLIPVQLEAPSLDGLSEAVQTIQSVQRQQNPGLKIAGILPTMCDFRYQEQKEFLESLTREYGDLVLPHISRRAEITYAVSEGLDIFSFKPARMSREMVSASQSTHEFAVVAEELRRRMDR
ncbi:MAG: ParA family protein [Anaerolineales bacterium]